MKTYDLFQTQGRGFYSPVNGNVAEIIANNPDGMCLWVEHDRCYMEVDCPNETTLNARFEFGEDRICREFPYTYDGFVSACAWFDEIRGE